MARNYSCERACTRGDWRYVDPVIAARTVDALLGQRRANEGLVVLAPLQQLGILPSLSRLRVSEDGPFSVAVFIDALREGGRTCTSFDPLRACVGSKKQLRKWRTQAAAALRRARIDQHEGPGLRFRSPCLQISTLGAKLWFFRRLPKPSGWRV
jgi:hypothetical protein